MYFTNCNNKSGTQWSAFESISAEMHGMFLDAVGFWIRWNKEGRGMLSRFVTTCFVLVMLFYQPVSGFVIQTIQDFRRQIVTLHWSSGQVREGIPFWINADSFPFAQSDVLRTIRNSFSAWQNVDTSVLSFREEGIGNFQSSGRDNRNVVVYDAVGTQIGAPRGSGVIAVTRVSWNSSGEITDADIVFNGRDFDFSVTENSTLRGRVDLQDVLTHEIGHFLGLDHTPLVGAPSVRPTMNPFNTVEAPRAARTLELDDRAGVSALYPSAEAGNLGAISGVVKHPDGRGAYGVHVVAYQAGTNTFVTSTLTGANSDGSFRLLGLPPGDYQVAIEPLNGEITFENFGGIFDSPFDSNFDREFYDNASGQQVAQTIRVDAGQVTAGIDFMLGSGIFGAPTFASPALPVNTPDERGPYDIAIRIEDNVAVVDAELVYRVNEGGLETLRLERGGGDIFTTGIPGQKSGSVIDYRIIARDGDGNETLYPEAGLPMLRFEVFAFSGEPVLYVAMRRSGTIAVFATGYEREVSRIPSGVEGPLSVVLSGDGKYLFVANLGIDQVSSQITVVETATNRMVETIDVGDAPLDLAVSPNGNEIYVTNSEGRSVSVLDVDGLRERQRFSVVTTGSGPFGIVASPDGTMFFVTDIEGDRVLFLNAKTGVLMGQVAVVPSPRSLVISDDGERLYVAGFGGGVSVVDTKAQTVLQTISTTQGVFRLALSADEKRLFASDPFDANVLVIDLEQSRVVETVQALFGGLNTRDLAMSPDGQMLYVTNQDSNDLLFLDTASLQIRRAFKLGDGPRGIAVLASPIGANEGLWAGADFDSDGEVGFSDFLLFAVGFGTSAVDFNFDTRFDLDGDDSIGFGDFLIFAGAFGRVLGS